MWRVHLTGPIRWAPYLASLLGAIGLREVHGGLGPTILGYWTPNDGLFPLSLSLSSSVWPLVFEE
jgi:hypothetical protein